MKAEETAADLVSAVFLFAERVGTREKTVAWERRYVESGCREKVVPEPGWKGRDNGEVFGEFPRSLAGESRSMV